MENGAYGVVFLNRLSEGTGPVQIQLDFSSLPAAAASTAGIPSAANGAARVDARANSDMPSKFEAFDVWNDGASLGDFSNSIAAKVAGSSVAFYKLVPLSQ